MKGPPLVILSSTFACCATKRSFAKPVLSVVEGESGGVLGVNGGPPPRRTPSRRAFRYAERSEAPARPGVRGCPPITFVGGPGGTDHARDTGEHLKRRTTSD